MKKANSLVGAAYNDLIKTRKTLMTIIAAQGISILLLIWLHVTGDETVVVVPSTIDAELRISEGSANEAYQRRFSHSVALLAGNVSKTNIGFVQEQLEDMLSPQLRSDILPTLRAEANLLKVKELSQDFIISDMIWSNKADLVYVWGKKITRNNSLEPLNTEVYTYEVRVKPFNGRPRIVHLKGYKGAPDKNPRNHIRPEEPFYETEVAKIDAEGKSI